jgi:hypothetical protein
MNQEDFICEISDILQVRKEVVCENWKTNIFIEPYNFRAEDLFFLYIALQTKLNIRFNKEKIIAGEFKSLNEIFLSIH